MTSGIGGDSASQSVQIRRLTVDDALPLKACFERCYGTSYVAGYFYGPGELRERIASGRLRSVIAETTEGQIVGHMGLTVRHPEARTVDAGNTIVDPAFRGQRIVQQLGLALNVLCEDEGFLGYHHYPTTVHPIMQQLSVADKGTETGVMLAYVPAGTEYRELEGAPLTERPAATVVWRPFAACPSRTVYIPDDYAAITASTYAHANLDRDLGVPLPTVVTHETDLTVRDDQRRGLLHVDVHRPGLDLPGRVEETIATSGTAEVVHVDLRMDDPSSPAAAELLRKQRFLFCAVLPEYLQGDILRLQRLRNPALPRPNLINVGAKAFLALIRREHEG